MNPYGGVNPWVILPVVALWMLLGLAPVIVRLLPAKPTDQWTPDPASASGPGGRHVAKPTDRFENYGYICSHTSTKHCRIDEGAREPWPHRSPDGKALCCDQGVVAWPYPCPWHPGGKAPAPYYTEAQTGHMLTKLMEFHPGGPS